MNRRRFLHRSLAVGTAAGLSATPGISRSPNDRMSVGFMGCGGRSRDLMAVFIARPDIHVKYVCDVDPSRLPQAAETVDAATGTLPTRVRDFRRMLDDPDLDIVVIAVNHHWHALATIMACQAGKHVYVEKPMCQNIWESRKMVEAARKYNCRVQVGTQNRSFGYIREAADFLQSGGIGKVHQVRIINMIGNAALSGPPRVQPVPDGLDYDKYCGPAPMVEYRGRWMYRQLWDFSMGAIWDNAIHQTDVARWVLGLGAPTSVHSTGGVLVNNDGRETPDTLVTTWDYDGLLMHLHASNIAPYNYFVWKTHFASTDAMPDWRFFACPVEIYGTEGKMILGRHGAGWLAFGPDRGELRSVPGRADLPGHIANLIDCVRSGARPNADVEEAHASHVLGHLSNIALRVGRKQLRWDGAAERFIDAPEANALLKREYRAPWVVPDQV